MPVKWQFHQSWTFIRRFKTLSVLNTIPTIHSFSFRCFFYSRYKINDSQVTVQKTWADLFRFTGLRILRKIKVVHFVLKGSFRKAKELVMELSTTRRKIYFTRDFSVAISTTDGELLKTMKGNGLLEQNAVMASTKVTMQSEIKS